MRRRASQCFFKLSLQVQCSFCLSSQYSCAPRHKKIRRRVTWHCGTKKQQWRVRSREEVAVAERREALLGSGRVTGHCGTKNRRWGDVKRAVWLDEADYCIPSGNGTLDPAGKRKITQIFKTCSGALPDVLSCLPAVKKILGA